MTAGTYYDGTFSVRAHTLRLNVSASEDIVNNTSTVSWSLEVYRHPSYKPYGSDGSWGVNINGSTYGGTFSYNFNSYSYLLLASGSTVVAHNADGTKSISVSGSGYLGSAGGSASTGGTYNLDTIPRATQPTVSPTSGETGDTFTIGHVPATSTFTHDVAYSVDNGANYTDIVTGLVGTDPSTDWTPPSTLLPNTTSVTALIRVITKSGATTIGSKTVSLPLTVPASVKPTISSISWVDAQTSGPDMPTLMGGAGRFVQRWSKLLPTVTSAGAAGSTVVDSDVTIAGQTTDSGVAFGLPVTLSGAVPFTAVVLDSRARLSDTFSSTVAVTAYNFPSLPTPLVTRTSDAAGLIPSPTGTYLAITPAASVSSLNFSGEKNLLEWQVRTRPAGGSWTTKQAWTTTGVSGTTWTTKAVYSTYLSSVAYEVEVSIRDVFGKNAYDTANTVKTLTVPVASETIFMDQNGQLGLGLGGYHTGSGKFLQVTGGISQDGEEVLDFSDVATTSLAGIVELATDAETITGSDAARVVTPHGLSAAISARFALLPGRNKVINGKGKINQRGAVSGTSLASGVYFLDRWRSTSASNSVTWTGDDYAGRVITVPSSKTIATTLERADMPAATYTLSQGGTAQGRIYKAGTTAPSFAALPLSASLDGSGDVVVEFSAGTVFAVQVEVDSVATPYEEVHPSDELQRCQRYYYQIPVGDFVVINPYTVALAAGAQLTPRIHPVPMRVAPTLNSSVGAGIQQVISYYNNTGAAAGSYYLGLAADAYGFGIATYTAAFGGNGGVNLAAGRTMGTNVNIITVSAEF